VEAAEEFALDELESSIVEEPFVVADVFGEFVAATAVAEEAFDTRSDTDVIESLIWSANEAEESAVFVSRAEGDLSLIL
jgi:hypothetical protein